MRRRRYLQAAALGASGLAGCNALDQGTDTPTTTPTSTMSPTATPREEAPNVDPPPYMDLLPKQHLKGTDKTPNANFVRVDWDWYLSHYDTEMQFGATSEENWTLEANAGNLTKHPPPQYRLLHTPIGATIQMAGLIANIIPLFPNLGPELVRQCGFEMINESGHDDSRARNNVDKSAEIDDIVAYGAPGITYFIGINIGNLKKALQDNEQAMSEQFPETVFYTGNDRMSGRRFFVSEAWNRPVLCVETGNEGDEAIRPAISRVSGVKSMKGVTTLESIQWGLSRLNGNLPVVVGQINGGRAKFATTNYVQSPIRSLQGYDTVLNGLNIRRGLSATAQVVASHVEGEAPTVEELRELYGSTDGAMQTEYKKSVSHLTVSWGR
jgi:hypothetical protein